MKLIRTFFKDLFRNLQRWFVGKWSAWNFRMAKEEAKRLCAQYHRKYYVIQSSPVHWEVFSTADVRMNKKRGIFKKDLTWKEMTEKSAYVVIPKNNI